MLSDITIHAMRGDEASLRSELEAVGVQFKGRTCRCPFHDDRHPSAGIYCDEGAWKFKCQVCGVGGDIFDVRAALNKSTVADELKKEEMRRGGVVASAPVKRTFSTIEDVASAYQRVEAVYQYTNPATGKPDLAVIRYRGSDGRKHFTQVSPAPGGLWWEKGLERNPLYNRTRVAAADTVVVVEGEKCVHALQGIGIVATTSPGGSSAAEKADWSPLAGKRCLLWQDNDDPGTKYIQTVRRKLADLTPPAVVEVVQHDTLELGEGGDAADFIERYGSDKELARQAVDDVLAECRGIGPFGDYVRETDAILSGQRRIIPLPHRGLHMSSRALMPGTLTVIFGPPGATKSLFLCECLCEWHQSGIKACIFELEDDRTYHMRRIHAQLAHNSRITDNDWIQNDAAAFVESRTAWGKTLEEIGRSMWDAPDEDISHEMIENWVLDRAKQGYDVIAVDPATAAASKDKVWAADQRFIFRVKTIARQYGTRIILVTHPRKDRAGKQIGLDDMAGGAAYQRFAHTVFLVEWNENEKTVWVENTQRFRDELVPNRFIRIAKARNGPGAGSQYAFNFHAESLRFEELGIVRKNGNE